MSDNTIRNPNPSPQMDVKDLLGVIDFKKVGDTLGTPELGMIESAKIFQAQLEYQQRAFDMLFEMFSELYIRWFGKGKYGEIYKKHFPKGRQYYIEQIAKADKVMAEMQNKILGMVQQVKEQQDKNQPEIKP